MDRRSQRQAARGRGRVPGRAPRAGPRTREAACSSKERGSAVGHVRGADWVHRERWESFHSIRLRSRPLLPVVAGVRPGGGRDGLSVIGTGVGDVPITVRGGAGADGIGVVGTEDALLASDAPVTIFGGDGIDNLSASVPGSAPVSIDAGAGDDVVF